MIFLGLLNAIPLDKESIEPYVAIVVAILGLASPILLQITSQLDEKYNSTVMVEIFNKEFEVKGLKWTLASSLLALLMVTLKLKPWEVVDNWISNKTVVYFIDNSANILFVSSTVSLVIFFLLCVEKTMTYTTPSKLAKYLISKENKVNLLESNQNWYKRVFVALKGTLQFGNNRTDYFQGINDLLVYSIKNNRTELSNQLSDDLNLYFSIEREKQIGIPVEYPQKYYRLVYNVIEELVYAKGKRNSPIDSYAFGGIWLLGQTKEHKISDSTYKWMWYNIQSMIKISQDDIISILWENNNNYLLYRLKPVNKKIKYEDGECLILNHAEVSEREAEINRFVKFHYYFGALILHSQHFNCLNTILNYSGSDSFNKTLLPRTMDDIFFNYYTEIIRDDYYNDKTFRSFTFPSINYNQSENDTFHALKAYFALLFLRQYTLVRRMTYDNYLELTNIPEDLAQISKWIKGIDVFTKLVAEHLKNNPLLVSLGYDHITDEWCKENKNAYPLDLLADIKKRLKEQYELKSNTQELSKDKIIQFNSSSNTLLKDAIDRIMKLNNFIDFTEIAKTNGYTILGMNFIQSKDVFAENPEISHNDFDSFMAGVLAQRLNDGLGEMFSYQMPKIYNLRLDDFSQAIGKLGVSQEHVVVKFNFEELKNERFNGAEIVEAKGTPLIYDSVIILRKCDLPKIESIDFTPEEISKFKYSRINDKYFIYTSFIDLNKVPDVDLPEILEGQNIEEPKKQVKVTIAMLLRFTWLQDIKIVLLKRHYDFDEETKVNTIADIDEVWKPKSQDPPESTQQKMPLAHH